MTEAKVKESVDESTELVDLIIDAIQDIKGKNILKMDLRKVDGAPSEYFIICEGDSTTQIRAISGNIQKMIKEELSVYPSHKEGVQDANWILVDYFDVVVHVFYPETRKFYDLEDLWGDADITSYENL